MEDLRGKVVMVTGAARGMGKCTAMNFAREGSRVVITDLDEKELDKTASEMRDAGYDVHPYIQDVSDRAACFELVKRIESEVGPIDVLVNNAAIALNESVLETSEEHFRRITDVNYFGQIWMMQAVVPGMLRRKSGHVVNMCSIAGKVAVPLMAAYCATKHALIAVTDSIRMELRGSGVNFTIVNPGYIATGMFEGTKPPIITRWVEPQKVSDALLVAVKKNQAEIFEPAFVTRLTAFLRGLGLPKLMDFSFKTMGVFKTFEGMKKDRGRPF
ncbi:MAG: SDR family NAD(P)-dependent oxidoreductase [Actinobacteria bacterium]|nr:SDR family NAD(P)-dependent oxidoreductase [Actinomycetota bacterium]